MQSMVHSLSQIYSPRHSSNVTGLAGRPLRPTGVPLTRKCGSNTCISGSGSAPAGRPQVAGTRVRVALGHSREQAG